MKTELKEEGGTEISIYSAFSYTRCTLSLLLFCFFFFLFRTYLFLFFLVDPDPIIAAKRIILVYSRHANNIFTTLRKSIRRSCWCTLFSSASRFAIILDNILRAQYARHVLLIHILALTLTIKRSYLILQTNLRTLLWRKVKPRRLMRCKVSRTNLIVLNTQDCFAVKH